ncbi:hypothetical protein [Arcanobacterium phocae]|uniref:hypothetical protein n=1 Tax=Arcanobacterium phocae TaxID=131112 RepID=UPI001C0F16A7|nr:hypothetical protein [Arcanobacterium phocae]
MWTSANDVLLDWIGDDKPEDVEVLERWVGRAERLIRREIPGIQARITAGAEPDLLDTIKDVVSAMVSRVFRNPEGIRQRQETDGSFTGSITFSGDQPGSLFLTDAERNSLLPEGHRRGKQEAYTFGGVGFEQVRHRPWCDVMFGANRCSCGAMLTLGNPLYEEGL